MCFRVVLVLGSWGSVLSGRTHGWCGALRGWTLRAPLPALPSALAVHCAVAEVPVGYAGAMREREDHGEAWTSSGAVVESGEGRRRQRSAYARPSIVLKQHREAVLQLAHAHRADHVRVFGSVARGDDIVGSDLDILVRLPEDADVFDLAELKDDIERLTGLTVDIVSERGLNERGEAILAAAVAL